MKSIRHGISQDLQRPVGQSVEWRLFDATATSVDDTYDIGAHTGGRVWKAPVTLPVVNAYVFQNEMYANDRGCGAGGASDGGGAGGYSSAGANGTDNTGGGGGGGANSTSSTAGGNGGSGIVIVRYVI